MATLPVTPPVIPRLPATGDRPAVPPFAVPAIVAAVATGHPERTALVAACGRLTYGELDHRAGRVAAWLGARGIGRETLVGVCLERSFDQLVLILGIWKAGAAFLPLDPAWPNGRLRTIVDEAACALVVGRADTADRLPGVGTPIVALDWGAVDAAAVDAVRADGAVVVQAPEALAYVIYTSGTTGRPKGVEVTHANLSHLVAWHNAAFAVTAGDRGSHLAGLGFDASLWEVWPYLCAGAAVVLAPDAVRTSDVRLRAWLVAEGVTIAFVPTALAQELIRDAWGPATRLRYLLTGADRLLGRPRADLPFALVNNYGPTECTVVATSALVPPAGEEGGLPAIGRPIAGTTIRILDAAGRPVAGETPGEIHIGGPQVARGYRHQPALTAERFVADPSAPSGRLYRTGDRAAWRADGQIAFLGRLDDQAKVRGHRVEPEETAGVLRTHPAVRAAAVIAAPAADGGDMLVAYLVSPPADLSAEALRAFLAGTLPDYMIPAAFVVVDALPLTANGKLDKAALPPPGDANALASAGFAGAETPVEQRLAEILEGVLGRGRVGVDDNFFLLGGHSLLGTQVVLRAGEAFGIELTLRDLFQAPTVRRLAQRIEAILVAMIEAMSDDEAAARAAA